MKAIKTTYTVNIKKKIEKEVWKVDQWRLKNLEKSIKNGCIKNKIEAFKHILVSNHIDEEVELEKQVYENLPFNQKNDRDNFVIYNGVRYPITNMVLDTDNKTFVMEVFVENEHIKNINYDELEKAFDGDYETNWKKLIDEVNNRTEKKMD